MAARFALSGSTPERHSLRVARLGQLVNPLDHPTLLAWDRDRLAGRADLCPPCRQCEVLTLHAAPPWLGAGTALLQEVERIAAQQGSRKAG